MVVVMMVMVMVMVMVMMMMAMMVMMVIMVMVVIVIVMVVVIVMPLSHTFDQIFNFAFLLTLLQISIIWRTNQSGSFLICIFPPTSRSTNRSGRILGWELFNLWEIWSEGSQAHKSISRTRGIAKGLQSFTILDHP